MIRIFIYFIIGLNFCTNAQNVTNYVFTRKMAQACKEHICQDGYSYNTFYSVDDENMKEITKNTEMAFEMHLGIQAVNNGHILLSPVPRPGDSDPVYEFVVGGGGNKFTELRRNLKRNAKKSVLTPKILSSFEARGFYIKIQQDGLIEFGREGESLPLLSYMDVSPLQIKYFSFAAWTGVEVKFLYDCPVPGANTTSDSQEIERRLSPTEEFKRSRLQYLLPWIPPKPQMDVTLGIKVTNVKYDPFQSKLITSLSVVVSWTDEGMSWFPGKYNISSVLKFHQGQIWSPRFYIFNSDNMDPFDARNTALISMTHDGEATFHFQSTVYTWCTDSSPGLSKWPHDEYECSIVIQAWEAHEKISIGVIEPNSTKMQVFAGVDDVTENEWEVSTKQFIVKPNLWNHFYSTDDNETHQSDRYIIDVTLKRHATAYNVVFYTPLLVLVLFVLMSFWSEPLVMDRIWFLAGCSVVISMGLCYIDYLIPSHTLPSILVLYTNVLFGVLLALLIQAFLMTTAAENISKMATVQRVIRSNVVRIIFCLPYVASSASNGGYFSQEDEDPQATPISREIEEMESENEGKMKEKMELAEVIDRILFMTYTITFAAMLGAHF
ncbi:neuronal acetylcholine receptor subunit alpha-5-like [Trichoplusia ni]|uniref:Neuronal acetylcholine receptor subunit alpha-5-like n=1 Tax=Trichoplusia ni TaxID=7111 RepID=A0A7E5W4S5_TRINI|nr:neuronal acetylcholine receptor subunit alpha-5-like [Trichoplusia ni]